MSNDPHIPPGWQPATKPQGFMKVFAGETLIEPAPGMTLRDWFAGQALAGLCARDWCGNSLGNSHINNAYVRGYEAEDENARLAWKAADAMLRAREGKP